MSAIKPQWRKRVDVFRFIYGMNVIENVSSKEIKQKAFEDHLFDEAQIKIIDYYADHKEEIIKIISSNLDKTWSWSRIPQVDKAALITAYAEAQIKTIDKKIIIDQCLITIKNFGHPDSIKYINAILDKIIK